MKDRKHWNMNENVEIECLADNMPCLKGKGKKSERWLTVVGPSHRESKWDEDQVLEPQQRYTHVETNAALRYSYRVPQRVWLRPHRARWGLAPPHPAPRVLLLIV
jgi:hypothetical protein